MYPQPVLDHRAIRLDNYTDALMLDTSFVSRPGGPLVAAMAADHMVAAGLDPIASLKATVSGSSVPRSPYSYYWHGYQVALRPLLLLFSYGDIRYLNMLALGILALVTIVSLNRRAGTAAAIAFALALIATGFYVVPLSLQFSSMTYVMLVAVLVILAARTAGISDRLDVEILLAAGMLTAFLDLLTAPLLTLGVPLAVVLILAGRSRSSRDLAADARAVVGGGVAWVVGYAGCWVAKWAIGTVVLRTDVFRAALAQLLFRTGMDKGGLRYLAALRWNILNLFPILRADTFSSLRRVPVAAAVAAVLMLTLVTLAVVVARRSRATKGDMRKATPVLLVAPLPYLWFVVVNNHSAIHNWFTYRIQAITIFAVLYVLLSAVDLDAVGDCLARAMFGKAIAPPENGSDLGGE